MSILWKQTRCQPSSGYGIFFKVYPAILSVSTKVWMHHWKHSGVTSIVILKMIRFKYFKPDILGTMFLPFRVIIYWCFQEKVVTTLEADRHYTVFVSCSNKNLTIFPGLPEHTRTLDLTGNMVNGLQKKL